MKKNWREDKIADLLRKVEEIAFVGDSQISLVSVDKQQYQQQALHPERFADGISAEIIGMTYYRFADLFLRLVWRISDARYSCAWGILPGLHSLHLQDVELPSGISIYNGVGGRSATTRMTDALHHLFNSRHQHWKVEAVHLPVGLQPTHFCVRARWGGYDVKPVQALPARDFHSLIRSEGLHFCGCRIMDNQAENSGCVRGYAAYRAGSEISNIWVYMNWMMFARSREGETPEVMLVEGESIPGVVLAGGWLCDKDNKRLSPAQEVVFLLRVLRNRREWLEGCLDLFRDLSGPQEQGDEAFSYRQPDLFDRQNAVRAHVVTSDSGQDLTFEGARVARVIDSATTGATWVFDLYKTSRGQWVGAKQLLTSDRHGSDSRQAKVLPSCVEVVRFFGSDSNARNLYRQAGIDYLRHID